MSETINICIIGGSNSLMKHGYTAPLACQLKNKTGKNVYVENLSIGATFSHFGLWQAASKGKHLNADVIIVEYGINDAEISGWGILVPWARAYEGLIARLRKDNPKAQIVYPLFTTRSALRTPRISWIDSGIAMVNQRYDVCTIDISQEIFGRAPVGFSDYANDWHSDDAHYRNSYQLIISEIVAGKILENSGRARFSNYLPVTSNHYGNAQSAVKEGFFDAVLGKKFTHEDFVNSVSHERAIVVEEDDSIEFIVKGSLICFIVVATKDDGVVKVTFGEHIVYISLRRKALDESDHKFLLNILIPDQYFRKSISTSETPVKATLSLLSDAQLEALNDVKIEMRGTARLPDKGIHKLALVDILYQGEITKAGG